MPAVPGGAGAAAAQDALESDNDRLLAELEARAGALKQATQAIHDEVQTDNVLLTNMVRAARLRAGRSPRRIQRARRRATPSLPVRLSRQSADFERTGSLLTGTVARLDGLVRAAGGSPHMCRLVAFIVALFVGLWFVLRKVI